MTNELVSKIIVGISLNFYKKKLY